jgi:hypothetical protein
MYGKQITFRLDKKLYRKLEKVAKIQMRSIGGVIRLIIEDNINKIDKKKSRTAAP